MAPHITVITAFKYPILALGVQRVLTASADIVILAECSTLAGAVRAARRYRPRVLVAGTAICDGRAGAVEMLARASVTTQLALYWTGVGEIPEHARLQGASAVLPAEISPEQLVDCVHALAAGRRWHAPSPGKLNGVRLPRSPTAIHGVLEKLSARERQIAQAVATGRRNREIADAFGIAPGTVKLHLNRIYAKVGVNSRLALLSKLVTEGTGE